MNTIHNSVCIVKIILITLIFSPQDQLYAFQGPKRIESTFQNIGESSKIQLRPGLISVIEFPYPISEVRVGNPNSVKALISQISPKELTLYFKSTNAVPTNLIVRSDRKVFVFDLIPSKTTHQDFIKIRGSVGSIGNSNNLQILQSAEISTQKIKTKSSNSKRSLEEKVSL